MSCSIVSLILSEITISQLCHPCQDSPPVKPSLSNLIPAGCHHDGVKGDDGYIYGLDMIALLLGHYANLPCIMQLTPLTPPSLTDLQSVAP